MARGRRGRSRTRPCPALKPAQAQRPPWNGGRADSDVCLHGPGASGSQRGSLLIVQLPRGPHWLLQLALGRGRLPGVPGARHRRRRARGPEAGHFRSSLRRLARRLHAGAARVREHGRAHGRRRPQPLLLGGPPAAHPGASGRQGETQVLWPRCIQPLRGSSDGVVVDHLARRMELHRGGVVQLRHGVPQNALEGPVHAVGLGANVRGAIEVAHGWGKQLRLEGRLAERPEAHRRPGSGGGGLQAEDLLLPAALPRAWGR
mmetsp:Transcript_26188/g.68357  ORF Transcript_26188/g.68357 Transcript_26188/m.68357 type:complete len:260 (+) Transcript_26188:431-1210(+)